MRRVSWSRPGFGVDGEVAGDRVMAFAPGALASHIRTQPRALVKLPEGLGDREAATLPVAYMTTIYALETIARLSPGEWVLIHAGAGGVGVAAIRYAPPVGARVIATAGLEAKRTAAFADPGRGSTCWIPAAWRSARKSRGSAAASTWC